MSKQKLIIAATVLFIMVSGIYYSLNLDKSEEAVFVVNENETEIIVEQIDSSTTKDTGQTEERIETKIYVHICGQVRYSGVYCLEEGRRVMDLVDMAGGFTDDAARDYINLAQKLIDGQRIYIPSTEETIENPALYEGFGEDALVGQKNGKVNLNTADKDTLMTLTGIGEAKAEAIIRYREEHGSFQSIEEITQIEGIKNGVFDKIKDEIET